MGMDRTEPGKNGVGMEALVGLAPDLDFGGSLSNVLPDSAGLDGLTKESVSHAEENNIHSED